MHAMEENWNSSPVDINFFNDQTIDGSSQSKYIMIFSSQDIRTKSRVIEWFNQTRYDRYPFIKGLGNEFDVIWWVAAAGPRLSIFIF